MTSSRFALALRRHHIIWRRQLVFPGFRNELENSGHSAMAKRSLASQRRKRPAFEQHREEDNMPTLGRMDDPYQHGEANMDEYLKKASLSPWVPLPDVACRKVFDLASADSNDTHVDLGSGDGRVNFHAIDYGIEKSIGIDIDETIVEVAGERLKRRHPTPDLKFFVADLLDEKSSAWELVQSATLITMHFAGAGLAQLRPILEKKLAGRECKIITCGYAMPGWNSTIEEVVLGTQLFLYEWGKAVGANSDDEFLDEDDLIQQKPDVLIDRRLENDKFAGSKVIERCGEHPIRGFDPGVSNHYDEENWSDEEDSEEEDSSLCNKQNDDVDAHKRKS